MLESLGKSLQSAFDKISRKGLIDRAIIEEVVLDIQRALLLADVNVSIVLKLSESIKERALKEKPLAGMTEKELILKVIFEELVSVLGKEKYPLPLRKTRILLAGLFGAGKTTMAGKLARYYQKRGLKPLLIQCDAFRPAAYDQLRQLGERNGITVLGNPKEKNAGNILKETLKEEKKYDVVIVDTSGRDALDAEMVSEIKSLESIFQPEEKLLVIPADMGQKALEQSRAFKEAIGITGVIVTKLDGTAKGGGALSACSATGARIRLLGVGEKQDDLEDYDPARFVGRLIGFGDLQTLLEKAKEAGMEEKSKKLMGGKFTLKDFYEQIEGMRNMGPISKIAEMIPGFSQFKIPKDQLSMTEEKLKKFKFIIESMTVFEKEDADEIDASRIKRIASGSGTKEEDVRELLKLYRQSKKMMKAMGSERQMRRMAKRFGMG